MRSGQSVHISSIDAMAATISPIQNASIKEQQVQTTLHQIARKDTGAQKAYNEAKQKDKTEIKQNASETQHGINPDLEPLVPRKGVTPVDVSLTSL